MEQNFMEQDASSAKIFKGVSHPKRIAILRILHTNGQMTVGELITKLNSQGVEVAQATVSQHLAIMRNAGIIHARFVKTKTILSVIPVIADELIRIMGV